MLEKSPKIWMPVYEAKIKRVKEFLAALDSGVIQAEIDTAEAWNKKHWESVRRSILQVIKELEIE